MGRDYIRQQKISDKLWSHGIKLHRVNSIAKAKENAAKYRYNVVICNFKNIDQKAFNFCSFIKSSNKAAVLIALMDKVNISIEEQLFDFGVNDVVVGRQASYRLLTKRIFAHLNERAPRFFEQNEDKTVRLKNTIIDFERREVWCNGKTHSLPGLLCDLLRYFLENPGRIVSRQDLCKSPIWSDSICTSAEEGGKTYDVAVSKLRKIIEQNPGKPQIIKTVRNAGWKLDEGIVAIDRR